MQARRLVHQQSVNKTLRRLGTLHLRRVWAVVDACLMLHVAWGCCARGLRDGNLAGSVLCALHVADLAAFNSI